MPFQPGTKVVMTTANQAYPLFAGHKLAKRIKIQPFSDSTGILSIGSSTLDVTTKTGVAFQCAAPSATNIPFFDLSENDAPNGLDAGEIYVSSSVGGDVALWSYNEQ